MTSRGARWRTPSADDEDGSAASSISDVFADMLNVNEDMIVAAAECQAEGDVEGLVAYQRILHRDLMEMAEFIDSMFGVYSNTNGKPSNSIIATTSTKSDMMESHVVDLTTEAAEIKAPGTAAQGAVAIDKKNPAKKEVERGALLSAIEAEEKVRETQRSKEQWIKSRHQVLEEEGVSVIMKKDVNGMLKVANVQLGEKGGERGGEGLAKQPRAPQPIAPFVDTSKEAAARSKSAPVDLPLASQFSVSTVAPPLQVPPVTVASAPVELPIKPCTAGNPKVALPPAHSMFNVLYNFPGALPFLFNPQTTPGFMLMPPWQPQLPTALPARTVVRPRPPVKKPEFKRMCESCRKRHFSVRQCRLALQHTAPEWQPTQPSPSDPQRKRKQSATDSTTQVT